MRHLAPPGRRRERADRHVVVAGAGIAGLAATVALAERGVRVTLLEREDQLGGRVRGWPVEVAGERAMMGRGFHAFFRQYYNLRALLRRADPELRALRPVSDYPLVGADGTGDSFAGLPRTPPLNLVALALRSDSFPLREMARINTAAAHELLAVEFPETLDDHDDESAGDFLDRLRFPDAARHLALTVFSRSFFADPDDFSAGELIAMFHSYFLGSAEGLLFDVAADDFDTALWAPLGRYLHRLGVTLRTGAAVAGIRSGDDGVTVATSGEAVRGDAVVVATDLRTTQRLLGEAGAMRADDGWRDRLADLRTAPPFAVCRWWLDRRADDGRPDFLGTAGFGWVDNVSLPSRFESGAAAWERRHGGSVVELHAYALPDGVTDAQVRERMTAVLASVFPELAGATMRHEEYLRREDCPLIAVGSRAGRPGVTTPDPRVVLAGDGVRCEVPVALMERAATTGFQAANHLLAGWGVAGHDLWTVPLRGRLPLRRRAAG